MSDEILYQLQTVKPADFAQVKVKNQPLILAKTRGPLEPQKAFEVIRNETKGFTQRNENAEEADRLMMALLKANGIKVGPATKPAPEPEPVKKEPTNSKISNLTSDLSLMERERMRMLDLLELELLLQLKAA